MERNAGESSYAAIGRRMRGRERAETIRPADPVHNDAHEMHEIPTELLARLTSAMPA